MIEQPKCLVVFPDARVDLRQGGREERPIKRVFGFRQQFDRALAFVNRFLFLAQARENSSELCVPGCVVRTFTQQLLGEDPRALERCLCLFFIAQMQILVPFKKSFWASGIAGASQRLSAKLLQHLKSIGKLPLQRQ